MQEGMKACQACGHEMFQEQFICPSCNGIQNTGPLCPPTKMRTALAPRGTKLTSVKTAIRSVPRLGPSLAPIYAGLVTFSGKKRLRYGLTPISQAQPVSLDLDSATNMEAALHESGQVLLGNPQLNLKRKIVIMVSDGAANQKSGLLGWTGLGAKDAAIKMADDLRSKGVTIGAIYFSAGDHDEGTLRRIVNDDNLFQEATPGHLFKAMFSMSKKATSIASVTSTASPGTGIVFCIDESLSMGEHGKKEEAERALRECLEQLAKCE